jgi:hypothetical protein
MQSTTSTVPFGREISWPWLRLGTRMLASDVAGGHSSHASKSLPVRGLNVWGLRNALFWAIRKALGRH